MKIISFAWTTDALLAGEKTMTRRDWTDAYARTFKAGELVAAWNQTPRVNRAGQPPVAKQIATIRITRAPYQQASNAIPMADYRREGFMWLDDHGERDRLNAIVGDWDEHPRQLWVVEFEIAEPSFYCGGCGKVHEGPMCPMEMR